MALEQERKFLIKGSLPIEPELMLKIKQGYFVADQDKQMRIRIIEDYWGYKTAILGYKKHINPTDKKEFEFMIQTGVGESMYEICDFKLEKTRVHIHGWDVDKYEFPSGKHMVVAEYEYSDEKPFPDELPSWVGEEITGIYQYSNIFIAKNWNKL